MRIVVTGASGNVGTALLRALRADSASPHEIVGICRRTPPAVPPYAEVQWVCTVSRRGTGAGPRWLACCVRRRRTAAAPAHDAAGANASWRAHLQPTDPGWVDLAASMPLLKTDRARTELEWEPTSRADALLTTFVDALSRGRGTPSPALQPRG
jgi:NAD(P)-dependent dehydrogenase (short-subunit alcohol dehydrogenase family)